VRLALRATHNLVEGAAPRADAAMSCAIGWPAREVVCVMSGATSIVRRSPASSTPLKRELHLTVIMIARGAIEQRRRDVHCCTASMAA